VRVDRPDGAEQQKIVTAVAILVDKLQLLTGEATSRGETVALDRDAVVARTRQLRDELAERRAASGLAADGG